MHGLMCVWHETAQDDRKHRSDRIDIRRTGSDEADSPCTLWSLLRCNPPTIVCMLSTD